MANQKDYAAVAELIKAYFEGLWLADAKILSEVFHPDARYVNLVESDYLCTTIPEYLKMVDKRTSPRDRGDERDDQILSVEFGQNKMAFVQVSLTMLGRNYLDFLTLSKDHHGWRIMTKVFHFIPFDMAKEPKENEQDWLS